MVSQDESSLFYTWGWQKSYRQIERGESLYLYDSERNRYLDAIGGSHLISIGHGVSEVADAMAQQARSFCFLSKVDFTSEPVEALASVVAEMAQDEMEHVGFVTSGSDANDIAIQVAHYYHREQGNPGKYKVIGQGLEL